MNNNIHHKDTKLFKIIYPKQLSSEEIEREEKIEKSQLVQSLRKDKILLQKSYSNEFSHDDEVT